MGPVAKKGFMVQGMKTEEEAMNDREAMVGLGWSTAERFLEGRPDLAPEAELLAEANGRRGTAAALSMADLSESISVMQSMGLSDSEIAAMLKVAYEYFGDPNRPANVMETVPGGFT
jgi:hypothetical protein